MASLRMEIILKILFGKSQLVGRSSLYLLLLIGLFFLQPIIINTYYNSLFRIDISLVYAFLNNELIDLLLGKFMFLGITIVLIYLIEGSLFFYLGLRFYRAFKKSQESGAFGIKWTYLIMLLIPIALFLIAILTSIGTITTVMSEFHALKGFELKSWLYSVWSDVQNVPIKSFGDVSEIVTVFKGRLFQDGHLGVLVKLIVNQCFFVNNLLTMYNFIYFVCLGVMSYFHISYWKNRSTFSKLEKGSLHTITEDK